MTTQTAVHFGTLSSPVKKRRPLRPLMWTCAGALAIPLWALWPTLSLQTRSIPPFECLMIAYLVGAIVLSRLERPARAVALSAVRARSTISDGMSFPQLDWY